MSDPETVEVVLARAIRQRLHDFGWRHGDLARAMRELGLPWSDNTPSQVLNFHRQLSLLELGALCDVFECGLVDLLDGDGAVGPPDHATRVGLGGLRGLLTSGKRTPWVRAESERFGPSAAETKAMARLGVGIGELQHAASTLFGTIDIEQERDRRVGELPAGTSLRAVQTKRGHAMRAVLAELREVTRCLTPRI